MSAKLLAIACMVVTVIPVGRLCAEESPVGKKTASGLAAEALVGLLYKVDAKESSDASRRVLGMYDLLAADGDGRAKIMKVAFETGNEDLLGFASRVVADASIKEGMDWTESVRIASDLSTALEALACWRFLKAEEFIRVYQCGSDLPYDKINEWHVGYANRGLQGEVAKLIFKYDFNERSQLIEMLGDGNVSESRKRTIIYAMRYGRGVEAKNLLGTLAELEKAPFASDAKESLVRMSKMTHSK